MLLEKVPRTFPVSLTILQGHNPPQSLRWAALSSHLLPTLSCPREATEGRIGEIGLYRQVPECRDLNWPKVTGGRLTSRVLKTHLLL